MLDIRCI